MSKKRGHQKPPPRCKAILLCDCIIIEEGTEKVSLINVFREFEVQGSRGCTEPVRVFLQLTDGNGRFVIRTEIHDLENGEVIARSVGIRVDFDSPLQTMNVFIRLAPMEFDKPGVYDFVAIADDQVIERQQFSVVLLNSENDDASDEQESEEDPEEGE